MFPHQSPVVMSGFMWYFPDQRKYSSRCCLAFNWIPIFFLLITLIFLILDFREKPEQLKPFWPRDMSGRPTCVVMLFKSTKVYRQVYQTRENATAKRFTLDYYNSLRERSHAASVITTNRCIRRGVRVPDLIWSCCPGILTPLITTAKQQHFTRAGMFGPQTGETHRKDGLVQYHVRIRRWTHLVWFYSNQAITAGLGFYSKNTFKRGKLWTAYVWPV